MPKSSASLLVIDSPLLLKTAKKSYYYFPHVWLCILPASELDQNIQLFATKLVKLLLLISIYHDFIKQTCHHVPITNHFHAMLEGHHFFTKHDSHWNLQDPRLRSQLLRVQWILRQLPLRIYRRQRRSKLRWKTWRSTRAQWRQTLYLRPQLPVAIRVQRDMHLDWWPVLSRTSMRRRGLQWSGSQRWWGTTGLMSAALQVARSWQPQQLAALSMSPRLEGETYQRIVH